MSNIEYSFYIAYPVCDKSEEVNEWKVIAVATTADYLQCWCLWVFICGVYYEEPALRRKFGKS